MIVYRLLHRLLLVSFPHEFRRLYGEQMTESSEARLRAAAARRRPGRLAVVLFAELRGCLLGGLAERWRDGGVVDGWRADGRYATLSLLRAPGFTLGAVAVLGLATGLSASLFAIVDGTLIRPLPFQEADRIALAWGSNPENGQLRDVIAGSVFVEMEREAESFERLSAFVADEMAITTGGRPEVVDGMSVTSGFFEALGVAPVLGRAFDDRERDSGVESTVMLAWSTWQGRFGGDAGIIGRRIPVDGEDATVIGVLPRGYRFLFPADIMTPLYRDVISTDDYTHYHYMVVGRLAPGVGPVAAARELNATLDRIAARDPRLEPWSMLVERLPVAAGAAARPALLALTAGVGFLMVLAVANLANLVLMRATTRGDDLAIRVAVGASRGRLFRQTLLEGGVLALPAAAVGLALTVPGLRIAEALAPARVPIPGSAANVATFQGAPDLRTASFALVLAVAAGLVLALPQAIRSGRTAVALTGRGARTTGSGGPMRDVLVVVELSAAITLAVVAVLSSGATQHLLEVDPGVDPAGVLTLFFGDLNDSGSDTRAAYYREVLKSVAAVPGVEAVGLNDYVPFYAEDDFEGVVFPERPGLPSGAVAREEWRRVSAGLFAAAGMRVLRGRGLEESDFDGGRPVVVVNEAFARKHFRGIQPVGERIEITAREYGESEIVGVVADVRGRGLAAEAPPMMYVPFPGRPRPLMGMLVRSHGDPRALVEPVREAIWSVDSSQPIHQIVPLEELVRATAALHRFAAWVLGLLGGAATALAGTGVFSVVAYSVAERRRELGIRMALGASSGLLRRAVVARTLMLCVLALPLAAAGVAAIGGLARTLVGDLIVVDPLILASTALLVILSASVASWVPAGRILRIEPARSLR